MNYPNIPLMQELLSLFHKGDASSQQQHELIKHQSKYIEGLLETQRRMDENYAILTEDYKELYQKWGDAKQSNDNVAGDALSPID